MTDLIAAAQRMGMSLEDIEILRQTTGGGMVDLGLSGPSRTSNVSLLQTPKPLNIDLANIGFGSGMPMPPTALPEPPQSQLSALMSRVKQGIPEGMPTAKQVTRAIDPEGITTNFARGTSNLGKKLGMSPAISAKVGRFAGRAIPVLGAISNASDIAGMVTGEESLGNKAMDAAAMTAGGGIGFMFGGPLGASLGASAGKALSDGAQWMFGDKKTPEQRKMELALQQLNGGGMF